MALGRATQGRRTVSLEEGAVPGGARCPACGAPLFVWVETQGWGPREDQVIDRCENCGLAVPRDAVPDAEGAAGELIGSEAPDAEGRLTLRLPNAASVQAWLGAENWAALRVGEKRLKPSPRAAELLLAKRGLGVSGVSYLAGAGMASMWQTLLNLLTFHRNFAPEALAGRLRPTSGKGRAAYAIDAMVTVLAAIPTALIAVLVEGGAVVSRRGGVFEVRAERLPD
jgi:hypothetical protein